MSKKSFVLALGVLAMMVPASASASGPGPWPTCVPRPAASRVGIRGASRVRHGRLIMLQLRSAAMGDVQPVDVLLPLHYDASGRTRYHVLFLLHGAGGSYQSWIDGHLTPLLGNLPVITVMPNGTEHGLDGDYTDWTGMAAGDTRRAPGWETFHIRELLPFIDSHFPIIPGPAGHAVAGISMGGGGATKYAAEYPGTFGYAGTFSGETHPLMPLALAVQTKNCRWGNPAHDEVIWRDNDSADLAANLRGMRVFIRSGDGQPGPYDSPTPPKDPLAALIRSGQLAIEYGARLENLALLSGLRKVHASVDVRFFHGSHSLPYWQRDMREFVVWLRAQFRHPPAVPKHFSVQSARTFFTAWGWSFHAIRRVREFAYVTVTGSRLRVTGSGTFIVATPRGTRLRLPVGPSHTRQQTAFGPGATRGWRTATAVVAQR